VAQYSEEIAKMTKQDALALINKMYADLVGHRGRTKHTYTWWRNPRNWKGTVYNFGYTPWKTSFEGKKGYWALKYRQFKNGNAKLVKAIRFGKRRVARDRSWLWYTQYYRAN